MLFCARRLLRLCTSACLHLGQLLHPANYPAPPTPLPSHAQASESEGEGALQPAGAGAEAEGDDGEDQPFECYSTRHVRRRFPGVARHPGEFLLRVMLVRGVYSLAFACVEGKQGVRFGPDCLLTFGVLCE